MIESNSSFSLLDFAHFPDISKEDKEEIKDKISSFLDSFTSLFCEMSEKEIECEIKNIETQTFSEMQKKIVRDYSVSYTRQLIDNHDQLFVSLSPLFVDSLLTSPLDKGKETFIKKAIADHFVLDIFKQLISKNQSSDYKESVLLKGQSSPYYIVENCEKEIKNRRFGQTNIMISVEIGTKESDNSIFITATRNGWRKLLGKKKTSYTANDISTHNAFAIFSEVNVSEERIKNLKKGEKIYFPRRIEDERVNLVVNRHKIDSPLVAESEDNKVNLVYGEAKENSEDYFINNENNLFLLLGTKEIKSEELENIYLNSLSNIEDFDSYYNEDLPLMYEGKIIALGEYITTESSNYVKITKIFEEPLSLQY